MLRTIALAAAFAALVALVVAIDPLGAGRPMRGVLNIRADGRDPLFPASLDASALRATRAALPHSARTYYLWSPTTAPGGRDMLSAGVRLMLLPAVPVRNADKAEWLVSYKASPRWPGLAEPERVVNVGKGLFIGKPKR